MTARVLFGGMWRPMAEAVALLDVVFVRTYKRDKDGRFAGGGGGSAGGGPVQAATATSARDIPAREANRWGREHFTAAADLPESERLALQDYGGGAYANVNKYLRTGEVGPSNRGPVEDVISGIDAAMEHERVPEDVVVSRACGLGIFEGDPGKMVGRVVSDPAYFSTSVGSKVGGVRGRSGARPVHMRIDVPAGTRGYYMRGVASFAEERELLLDRRLQIVVTGATQSKRTGEWTVTAAVLAS